MSVWKSLLVCAILLAGSASAKLCGVKSADGDVVEIEQECHNETSRAFKCVSEISTNLQLVQAVAPKLQRTLTSYLQPLIKILEDEPGAMQYSHLYPAALNTTIHGLDRIRQDTYPLVKASYDKLTAVLNSSLQNIDAVQGAIQGAISGLDNLAEECGTGEAYAQKLVACYNSAEGSLKETARKVMNEAVTEFNKEAVIATQNADEAIQICNKHNTFRRLQLPDVDEYENKIKSFVSWSSKFHSYFKGAFIQLTRETCYQSSGETTTKSPNHHNFAGNGPMAGYFGRRSLEKRSFGLPNPLSQSGSEDGDKICFSLANRGDGVDEDEYSRRRSRVLQYMIGGGKRLSAMKVPDFEKFEGVELPLTRFDIADFTFNWGTSNSSLAGVLKQCDVTTEEDICTSGHLKCISNQY